MKALKSHTIEFCVQVAAIEFSQLMGKQLF